MAVIKTCDHDITMRHIMISTLHRVLVVHPPIDSILLDDCLGDKREDY